MDSRMGKTGRKDTDRRQTKIERKRERERE